jgi:hypothetical protein
MPKDLPKKIDKNSDVSFACLGFWVLSRFRCFSAMGVQKHHKKRGMGVKSFYQKIDKKSKIDFFYIYILFYHVFERLSVSGVQNTTKAYKKSIRPQSFFGL